MPVSLPIETLIQGGFTRIGAWVSNGRKIRLDGTPAKEPAVYAFAIDKKAVYVGKASRSLKQRLYFYASPGSQQKTNHRLNALIKTTIKDGNAVDVYFAAPKKADWNGLPVEFVEGLEAGLIRQYHLPWNIQGASK